MDIMVGQVGVDSLLTCTLVTRLSVIARFCFSAFCLRQAQMILSFKVVPHLRDVGPIWHSIPDSFWVNFGLFEFFFWFGVNQSLPISFYLEIYVQIIFSAQSCYGSSITIALICCMPYS